MDLIAEFHLQSPALFLVSALTAVPEMRVQVEQHTSNEAGFPMFFFWASGGDFEAFEQALAADETVARVASFEETTDSKLYRVEFTDRSFYPYYWKVGAKILELSGTADGWDVQMRFPGREAFQEFRSYFVESDVTFDLTRLYAEDETSPEERFDLLPAEERRYGLTAVQYETLVTAFEQGYFSDPREVSLAELGEQFGVSTQAVAGRMRRAHETLVANTLLGDRDFRQWDVTTRS